MDKISNLEQYKKIKKEKFLKLKEKEKYAYTTLRNIFETFKNDDPDFLINLYPDIKNNVTEFWILEFLLRLEKLLDQQENMDHKKLKLYIEIMMKGTMISSAVLDNIKEVKKSFTNLDFGKGFVFITYQFYYSEMIIEHFAKVFLDFISDDVHFENLLHENYQSYEEFERKNTNLKTYITKVIENHDNTLSYYLYQHPNLLEPMASSFERIKTNWYRFEINAQQEIIETIVDQILFYIFMKKDQGPNFIRALKNMAWYACYNAGILDEVFEILEPDADIKSIRLLCMKLKESKHITLSPEYSNIKKLIEQNLEKTPSYTRKKELQPDKK